MNCLSVRESDVTIMEKSPTGDEWPSSARFKVEYRSHTANQQWGEVQVEYFFSQPEFDAWVNEIVQWTAVPGACFEYRLYERAPEVKYVTTVAFP